MSEAKHIICPVCGKVDIPDYHKEDVVCPSCGSDLSVYRMLYEYQEDKSKAKPDNKIWKVLTCSFIGVAIILVGLLIYGISCNSILNADLISLKDSTSILKNQVAELNKQIVISEDSKLIDTQQKTSDKGTTIYYVVKRGDTFRKISRKLYGTGRRYKYIAELNGLSVSSTLHIGDSLKIQGDSVQ